MRRQDAQLVPAHVRHRELGPAREARHALGNHAEAFGVVAVVAFLAACEQQLHAEADAEHGLGELRDQVDEVECTQAGHGVGRRADARQDHASRGAQFGRVGGQVRRGPEPFQREPQRRDVGAAVVDDGDVAHGRVSQHALAARQLGAFDAQRLAQRAADALEAGLDHVMRVLAAHLRRGSPRRGCRPASGRNAAPARSAGRRPPRGRNCPRTPRTAGPTGRSRPAPAIRPWAAGSRSGRCRACRRAPRAAPGRGPARSPRPCGARPPRGRPGRPVPARTRRGAPPARACDRRSRCRSRSTPGPCGRARRSRRSVSPGCGARRAPGGPVGTGGPRSRPTWRRRPRQPVLASPRDRGWRRAAGRCRGRRSRSCGSGPARVVAGTP